MFLFVLILLINGLNLSSDPFSSVVEVSHDGAMPARVSSDSSDELCDAALQAFTRKTDSDIARYIRPYLSSTIKKVSSSPESDSDSDSPSPRKVIRSWVRQPDSVRNTPRPDLDEIILSAVQKAFEEKDDELEKKSAKIEGMFSKKTTVLITTIVGSIVTVATSLGSVYGTMGNQGNCTK